MSLFERISKSAAPADISRPDPARVTKGDPVHTTWNIEDAGGLHCGLWQSVGAVTGAEPMPGKRPKGVERRLLRAQTPVKAVGRPIMETHSWPATLPRPQPLR